jgi:transposase
MFGLDVSKATLSCALMDPVTRLPLWEQVVPNTPGGVEQLLGRTPPDSAWVLEPTGRYSLSVAKQAKARGRQVLLAPPRKAKAFLSSIQSRAKTDRLDARGLGRFALCIPLSPYPIKSEAVERLSQLLVARKGLSQSLASLRQRIPELPYAAETLQRAVADLKTQLKALDQQIAAERKKLPLAARLEKVHGIGPVTAAAVGMCLTSRHFSHPGRFVAYLGLDVGVRQSGKRQGEAGLTRQGDAELRRLLFVCAKSSVRAVGSPFATQYERERAKGFSRTAALCAVARKMAKLCWSLSRHAHTEYDPTRVYRKS